jgi:hypothetical protein
MPADARREPGEARLDRAANDDRSLGRDARDPALAGALDGDGRAEEEVGDGGDVGRGVRGQVGLVDAAEGLDGLARTFRVEEREGARLGGGGGGFGGSGAATGASTTPSAARSSRPLRRPPSAVASSERRRG